MSDITVRYNAQINDARAKKIMLFEYALTEIDIYFKTSRIELFVFFYVATNLSIKRL